MDRYWLLTWTTYGTWLPGDDRGFVSNVRVEGNGPEERHNVPGTAPDAKQRGLRMAAASNLCGAPVYLQSDQAKAVLEQLQETAKYRGWLLVAVAIMRNHIHLIVGVDGDPEPQNLLRDFKSYASRKLNRLFGRPECDTWWTESGSKRKLPKEEAVLGAAEYVRNQEYPLVVWLNGEVVCGGKESGG